MTFLLAHAISSRADLPLPLWLFVYGAGGAVVASFAALAVLWPRARFEGMAGVPLSPVVEAAARVATVLARVLGVVLFVAVLVSAWDGATTPDRNLAPTMVYVIFWVGLIVVSALVGNVWAAVSPYATLARLRQRYGPPPRPIPERWGQWPAAVLLLGFAWLELVYPNPASPRAVAVAVTVYSAITLAGVSVWGRAWLDHGEAFGVLFGLLSHIAPFSRDGDGTLRVRVPLAGLASLEPKPGTAGVVLAALGSTSYDGLSRTRLFPSIVGTRFGWGLVPAATFLLLAILAAVAIAFGYAMEIAARVTGQTQSGMTRAFVQSLVPIVLAYAVAHYFSLLVFQGQAAYALVSDPLGRGWNLFRTAGRPIDYLLVSTRTIALVQAGAIVIGHISGVVSAHDRAVARFRPRVAVRSQYPLLAVMVLYTVGGLTLLLSG